MLKKLALFTLFIILLTIVTSDNAAARKVLPRLQRASSGTVRTGSNTKGVTTSVSFRGDRRAIIVNFSNLSIASSVSYTLSYSSRGTTQGAGGNITVADGNQTREIIFGTCSHGVCRYDSGITNAKFTVTTTLKNGRKIVKSFRLKV